jgi:hypothetical protein
MASEANVMRLSCDKTSRTPGVSIARWTLAQKPPERSAPVCVEKSCFIYWAFSTSILTRIHCLSLQTKHVQRVNNGSNWLPDCVAVVGIDLRAVREALGLAEITTHSAWVQANWWLSLSAMSHSRDRILIYDQIKSRQILKKCST